jgi:hypothetical protein
VQVWQGTVQASEKEILLELSSILNPPASKELSVENEAVAGGTDGDVNPVTVNPITELLKLPVILRVFAVSEVQVAAKSMKALHVRLVAVK